MRTKLHPPNQAPYWEAQLKSLAVHTLNVASLNLPMKLGATTFIQSLGNMFNWLVLSFTIEHLSHYLQQFLGLEGFGDCRLGMRIKKSSRLRIHG